MRATSHASPLLSPLPQPEAKEAALSALWPVSSSGFVCHKTCEFNPLQVGKVC